MWIARDYENTLQRLVAQFPVVMVSGARQVGKTSLVQRLFPDFSYVTLDLPSAAAAAEQSPSEFLNTHGEPLIIDEVQYAPSVFRALKVVVDQDKSPGRFILTGSQNFLMMQGVSESLAGRCGTLQMANLSFAELAAHSPDMADETTVVFKGGFPELYARPDIDPQFWFGAYLSTYLERDVRNVINIGSLRDYNRFLRGVALRTGQILSYSELAKDVGIAPNTAKSWISVLSASGQIHILEPYHRNMGKRLTKSPKLYMADTGLASFLMGFDSKEQVFKHAVAGAIWETHIVAQIFKHFEAAGKRPPIWFWRKQNGEEIDILLERGGQFVGIEVKLAELPGHRIVKSFSALRRFYGDDSLMAGLVACRTPEPYPVGDGIIAVPGSRIGEYIDQYYSTPAKVFP